MLTTSIPALTKALAGVLPEAAVRQLTQSLGNCAQPLAHRGPINVQPTNNPFALNGAGPGAIGGGTWNPYPYQGLLPTTDQANNVDVPGYSQGGWNLNNNSGGNFFFPTNQEFTTNSYYGGPTFNVAGDTNFTNQYVDNSTVTNLTVEYINGEPVAGRDGIDGLRGERGLAGPAGTPGEDGIDGFNGFDGLPGAPGAAGRDGRNANAGNLRFRSTTSTINYVTDVTFDPQTCTVKPTKAKVTFLIDGQVVAN